MNINAAQFKAKCLNLIDEVAELVIAKPEVGDSITRLSQMSGGLGMNLIAASQAANPSVFGDKGSLAQANFATRLVFQLPNDQSWLATKVKGQHTGELGGKGDGLFITMSGVGAREFADGERYAFDVRAWLPLVGLLVHYTGWLDVRSE